MSTPVPFRVPDLNAPRYRKPVLGTLNQATYAVLRQQVPQAAHLSDADLKKIILRLNQQIWMTVIQNRDGIELPELTGHLFLASCPGRRADSIDYKSSTLLGERVRQRNWESDGFLAKIFYTNEQSRYHFKHHELWGFEASKKFKQAVGQQYPRQWQMYTRIEPDQKLKSDFFRRQHELTTQARAAEVLTTYNELDF